MCEVDPENVDTAFENKYDYFIVILVLFRFENIGIFGFFTLNEAE